MKIVVTDGFTLNPGDLSWERFKELGRLEIFPRTSSKQILTRCEDAQVIITNKTPINAHVLQALSHLKLIAVTATGYNIIDTDEATRRGVVVCNVPGYGTDSVAQHTFALILELTNAVGINSASVNRGEWAHAKDWSYSLKSIFELSGKALGIVGYGRIGQKVAEIARAFGMTVLYHTPTPKDDIDSFRSIDELFRESDIVTLHCPLKADNTGFVNRRLLSLMKPTALLINTSRGQLINEEDLRNALVSKRILGAAVDVLSSEPPADNHPLMGIENCIITPHNAWLSFESRSRMMETTFQNVKSALEGKPQNVVN